MKCFLLYYSVIDELKSSGKSLFKKSGQSCCVFMEDAVLYSSTPDEGKKLSSGLDVSTFSYDVEDCDTRGYVATDACDGNSHGASLIRK